ncbi:MAG: galactose mutarotase, partial [Clostridia bacterium]|nr:galactose mutarotase [Clostridia bacterium]
LTKGSVTAEVMTYGGRITRLIVPDREGRPVDVLTGYESPEGYFADKDTYFGAIVGRVANRIKGGKFVLNGKEYTLVKNNGNNHLHGGTVGFDSKIWSAEIDGDSLVLTYESPDGEEGYPGTLRVEVRYTVYDDGLRIEYGATTDQDTLFCPTNHAYFNLNGDFLSVRDHTVQVDADRYIELDDELIPSGKILSVEGTPFDFRKEKKIGASLPSEDRMIKIGGKQGYDMSFILSKKGKIATAYGEKTGIRMTVETDAPCLQFYTGNFLDGLKGKKDYGYQSAFCMETQGYPGAANVPEFPSVVLRSGQTFFSYTKYSFCAE